MKRPVIKSPCVADRYAIGGERIAEFHVGECGGLISLRSTVGGARLEVYRVDGPLEIVTPATPASPAPRLDLAHLVRLKGRPAHGGVVVGFHFLHGAEISWNGRAPQYAPLNHLKWDAVRECWVHSDGEPWPEGTEGLAGGAAFSPKPAHVPDAPDVNGVMLAALKGLARWAETMGGWDAPCWRAAGTAIAAAEAQGGQVADASAAPDYEAIARAHGWEIDEDSSGESHWMNGPYDPNGSSTFYDTARQVCEEQDLLSDEPTTDDFEIRVTSDSIIFAPISSAARQWCIDGMPDGVTAEDGRYTVKAKLAAAVLPAVRAEGFSVRYVT